MFIMNNFNTDTNNKQKEFIKELVTKDEFYELMYGIKSLHEIVNPETIGFMEKINE